uniref:Protein kinase APK1Bic-like n=1 Tax=Rhizophora mucronata TaxID=61149 RepID=A0A2P2JRL4_RHIMU
MDSDFDPVDLGVNATKFSYEDLCNFTDGFSTDNFVGVFMWGDVFRGKAYLNGMQPQEVTVKIWDDSNGVIMDGYRDNSISRFRVCTKTNFCVFYY